MCILLPSWRGGCFGCRVLFKSHSAFFLARANRHSVDFHCPRRALWSIFVAHANRNARRAPAPPSGARRHLAEVPFAPFLRLFTSPRTCHSNEGAAAPRRGAIYAIFTPFYLASHLPLQRGSGGTSQRCSLRYFYAFLPRLAPATPTGRGDTSQRRKMRSQCRYNYPTTEPFAVSAAGLSSVRRPDGSAAISIIPRDSIPLILRGSRFTSTSI